MLPTLSRLFIFAVLLFAMPQRPATGLDFDRFSGFCTRLPAEQELLNDAADGSLDDCSLLRASLICAGHSEDNASRLENEFRASVTRCQRVVEAAAEGRAKEAIFGHLKDDFLYGAYRSELCDAGRAIAQGEFNCLTATILYQAFCHEFSIEVEALWEPSHVRCWVVLDGDGSGCVVEATASSVAEAVGPRTTRQALADRLLTSSELLGKVLYNRGVTALLQEQFDVALSATWASCLLDPLDQPAWNNLRACLNNWALAALESDRRELAKSLLDAGIRLDPDYEPFRRNWALLIGDR